LFLSRWLKKRSTGPLDRLQRTIGYRFKNINLLQSALAHRSSLKDTGLRSNERLEFLGDAVLGSIVSEFLYRQNHGGSEGELTRMKAALVNETVLSQAALSFGLGEYIYLSAEEEKSGGRLRPSITADAFEALLGAIYIDGGSKAASRFVSRFLLADYLSYIERADLHNYKGELLEWLQGRGLGMPQYRISDQIGPDHDKIFQVAVFAGGEKLGEGEGRSKKEAEQKAARHALQKIKFLKSN